MHHVLRIASSKRNNCFMPRADFNVNLLWSLQECVIQKRREFTLVVIAVVLLHCNRTRDPRNLATRVITFKISDLGCNHTSMWSKNWSVRCFIDSALAVVGWDSCCIIRDDSSKPSNRSCNSWNNTEMFQYHHILRINCLISVTMYLVGLPKNFEVWTAIGHCSPLFSPQRRIDHAISVQAFSPF